MGEHHLPKRSNISGCRMFVPRTCLGCHGNAKSIRHLMATARILHMGLSGYEDFPRCLCFLDVVLVGMLRLHIVFCSE